MSNELDTAAIIAGLIFWIVIIASGTLWVKRARHKNVRSTHQSTVRAWPIGWVNFGVLICTMIVCVFVVQALTAPIIHSIVPPEPSEDANKATEISSKDKASVNDAEATEEPPLTPWMAVWAVLSLQIPMLATFYGLRRLYPNHYTGQLNQKSLAIGQAMSLTLPDFIRYLPVIWVANLIWLGVLTTMKKFSLIDDFSPQELIETFSQGGDPLAILLLVVFAIVLAPIVEEIIFRGAIYRFMKSQTTPMIAQIISGFFFAILHGNLMSLLPLLTVGIILARLYERHGNILAPMCFHAYFNAFSVLLLFITNQSEIPFG